MYNSIKPMRKSILLFLLLICSSLCFAQFSKKPTWKDEFSGKGPLNKEMWKLRVSKESYQLTIYTDNEQNVYLKGVSCISSYSKATTKKHFIHQEKYKPAKSTGSRRVRQKLGQKLLNPQVYGLQFGLMDRKRKTVTSQNSI